MRGATDSKQVLAQAGQGRKPMQLNIHSLIWSSMPPVWSAINLHSAMSAPVSPMSFQQADPGCGQCWAFSCGGVFIALAGRQRQPLWAASRLNSRSGDSTLTALPACHGGSKCILIVSMTLPDKGCSGQKLPRVHTHQSYHGACPAKRP